MPTEEAFIQAIVADPEDDAPRLIYADWLDEQGESERAEFIRVQIALARMDEDDGRRPDLEVREQELLARHREAWQRQFAPFGINADIARGLPDQLTLSASTFLAEAHRSLARVAAHRVRFNGDAGALMGDLSRSPH